MPVEYTNPNLKSAQTAQFEQPAPKWELDLYIPQTWQSKIKKCFVIGRYKCLIGEKELKKNCQLVIYQQYTNIKNPISRLDRRVITNQNYRKIAKTSRTYIKLSMFKIRVIFEILLNSIVCFLQFSSGHVRVRVIIKVDLFSGFYGMFLGKFWNCQKLFILQLSKTP